MKNAKLSILLIILLLLHTLTVAFSFQYFFRTEPKLVDSGLTIYAPAPVGHWKFDEGAEL